MLEQTHRHLEIIVLLYQPTFDVRAMVESLSDPRIEYRQVEGIVASTKATGAALAGARSEFVCMVHDNHSWEPCFIETMLPLLRDNPDAAIAFCDHLVVDPTGAVDLAATEANSRRWKRDRLTETVHRPFIETALVDCSIPFKHATLIRKSAVDWDDMPDLSACLDIWMAYLTSRDGLGARFCRQRLTRYEYYSPSSRSETHESLVYCFRRFKNDRRLTKFHGIFEERYAAELRDLGKEHLREGRTSEARSSLWESLRIAPAVITAGLLSVSWLPAGLRRSMLPVRPEPAG